MSVPVPSQTGGAAASAVAPPHFFRRGPWLWISQGLPWRGKVWLVQVAFNALGEVVDCACAGGPPLTGGLDEPPCEQPELAERQQVVESCELVAAVLLWWPVTDLLALVGHHDPEASALPALAERLGNLAVEARDAAIHAWACANPVRRGAR